MVKKTKHTSCPEIADDLVEGRDSLVAQMVKNPPAKKKKESTCDAGDRVQSLDWADPLEEGHSNPLQYSCLQNAMDRGAWRVTVHRVAKNQTQLTD